MNNHIRERNIYLLSDHGRDLPWKTWRLLGGCGVPNCSNAHRTLGGQSHWQEVTLGEIEDACIVSGRSLAGYAVEHLKLPELARVEYRKGDPA